ncbi:MDR family MFS transporter [Streptomyces sp. DSM 41982]|uniref:MDR family MFS transporter n=1 Tax=Streptomyces evansiae TaxID=3075535 RepID=A0ABD5E141_9ACTN|nr:MULTISPECIES: MDR family MFS transporter [unclassified Streptomyces]MDT0414015.1 MDR family MFS transporter [Streptomyces sp. DSM 41982]SCE25330.1 drug resistance transporter, EmrB/QacA subfamily [Streptomyces sp. SolWspMP-sol7th]
MTTPDRAPARRTLLVLMVPLMLVLFLANLDQTIVAAALPTIGRDLDSASGASWVVTAYLLTSAITTLILGKLGDMYGRKRVFQFSIAVFLAGSLLCGLAPGIGALIAFRALQGIGGGGLNSLVQAITGDLVPARRRAAWQALTGVVATLALVAGPLLGGAFAEGLSWRWIFWINLPIGVAALFTVAAKLHLPRPAAARGRVDYAGAALVAALTTTALLVTTWGGTTYSWTSPLVLGLLAATVLALLAYVRAERRAAEPLTPPRLFRSAVFDLAGLQFFLATLVLFVGMLYVPMFLETVQHATAFSAGLYVIPLLLGLVAAAMVSGPLIAKTGRYKIYPVLGSLLTGGAMYWLAQWDAHTGPFGLITPLVVAGAGLGLFVQVSLLAGQNAAAYADLGAATGTLNFFKSLGGAVGAALFGAILAHALAHGTALAAFHTVFLWTLPFMGAALVAALAMREKPLSEEMREVAAGEVEVPEY